jgi:hypothetical protein
MTDYSQQWREYRRLRNLALAVFSSILLLGVMCALFGSLDSSKAGADIGTVCPRDRCILGRDRDGGESTNLAMSALWPKFCFQMVEQVRCVFRFRVRELRTTEVY